MLLSCDAIKALRAAAGGVSNHRGRAVPGQIREGLPGRLSQSGDRIHGVISSGFRKKREVERRSAHSRIEKDDWPGRRYGQRGGLQRHVAEVLVEEIERTVAHDEGLAGRSRGVHERMDTIGIVEGVAQ